VDRLGTIIGAAELVHHHLIDLPRSDAVDELLLDFPRILP
jgi:hypothetical protein